MSQHGTKRTQLYIPEHYPGQLHSPELPLQKYLQIYTSEHTSNHASGFEHAHENSFLSCL